MHARKRLLGSHYAHSAFKSDTRDGCSTDGTCPRAFGGFLRLVEASRVIKCGLCVKRSKCTALPRPILFPCVACRYRKKRQSEHCSSDNRVKGGVRLRGLLRARGVGGLELPNCLALGSSPAVSLAFEMLSQLFILTPRGDTIVSKDYRGDVVRGA